MKTLGILGGMGPMASAHFLQQILYGCQQNHSAIQDTDYPHIILNSIQLQGFDESGVVEQAMVEEQLKEAILELNRAGVEGIVIPCNTVHFFYSSLVQVSACPIFNLIEETCAEVQKQGYKRVGLLASESNLKSRLYQNALKESGVIAIEPDTKCYPSIGGIIQAVMGNRQGRHESQLLNDLIQPLKAQGAEAVILGCTELPLAIQKSFAPLPIIDSLEVLTKISLRFAYGF